MSASFINIIEIVILVNIFLLLNVYFIYPVILLLAAKIFKKPIIISNDYQPDISIIISAFNEENFIEDAIESIYHSEYPLEKINVIVGSDGSTDETVAKLHSLKIKYQSLEIYEFKRIGKNSVLNNIVPKAKTEIIFYMDADIRLNHDSLKNIISNFSDENLGAVIASMVSGKDNLNNSGHQGETNYQSYEKILRINESKIYSTVNSLGAFYGTRKSLYKPIPNELVCDDLYPLYAVALMNKRVIFDPNTSVNEVREKTLSDEFNRRIRLSAGGLATLAICKGLLSPGYGWVSFFLWNHKFLRWLSPIFLILIAVASLLIYSDSLLAELLLYAQIIYYSGAFLGWILEKLNINIVIFRIMLFSVSMNIGFLFGLFRFLTKKQNAKWER